ncbi:MAG: GNAT family N-acetyltransferase [Chloroflexi bacterium]|nr:GNAT family N-acetyltransferase [Chloroflexota bacterium]
MSHDNIAPADLVALDKRHVKAAAAVLTRAFQDDPLFGHTFSDQSEMKRKAPSPLFECDLGYGVRYGEVHATSANLEGVAVWLTSDNYPMTPWRLIRSVPLSVILGLGMGGATTRMKKVGAYLDATHARLAPFRHWFLQIVGVDPRFQGKGYAGRLLRPMFFRIDVEGLPCYVDTLDEKNVRLYEHFGFELMEKSEIPETGRSTWAMLRKAR